MVYQWKYSAFPLDADVVGKHIEKLEKKNGAVTAQMLLESARSEKSEVHDLFEWDDTVAAEKYRLQQAGAVIRCLAMVEDQIDENQNRPIRAFVNVGKRGDGRYINTTLAMSQEETRQIVLQHALEELSAFQTKYKGLTELANILDGIDQLRLQFT